MPSSKPLTVLVTGATGQQGGALARTLLARGHKVRALTRKPTGPAAETLRQAGADVAAGDLDDPGSLSAPLRGVDAVFAVATPYEAGPEAETRQGVHLVDAAREARCPHFVYSSVAGADRSTGIPHFESKRRVEEHLGSSALPFTILAPVYFMENTFSPWALPSLKSGTLARGLPPERPLQQIAVEDIARFAALVLERRDSFLGQRLDLASDELTGAAEAQVLSGVLGRPIGYYEIPLTQIRANSEDFALMMEWFDRVGYSADIAGLRRDFPEVGWRRFDEWARAQDWSVVTGGAADQGKR